MRKDKFKFRKRALACMLAVSMVVSTAAGTIVPSVTVEAAETDVTVINYYEGTSSMVTMDATSGKYSVVMPRMNGEKSYNPNYEGAYTIQIKQDGKWVDIDDVLLRVTTEDELTETGTAGKSAYCISLWKDEYFEGWGFSVILGEEFGSMTNIRFQSNSNEGIYLDYKFVRAIEKIEIKDADGDNKIAVGSGEGIIIGNDWIILNDGDATASEYGPDNVKYALVVNGSETTVESVFGNYGPNWGWGEMPPNHGTFFIITQPVTIRVKIGDVYADYEVTVLEPAAKGPEYNPSNPDNSKSEPDPGKTKAGYELIWADEFDGSGTNVDSETGLDMDKWMYQLGDGTVAAGLSGWGNSERQSYTNRPENIAVEDGLLRITARYEDEKYSAYQGQEAGSSYTSARIVTKGESVDEPLFTTTYGYVEARMAMPQTAGAWPAFWMLPQSTEIYGAWPISGEIDIMETTGISEDKTCSTLHYGSPDHIYQGSGYVELDSEIRYFHTYAVDWEPGKMTFYYDGEPVYTQTNWESKLVGASDSLAFDAPFDQPYYILLNLAVDSGQFGGADNKALFQDDINMYVDYVRVYHKEGGYDTSNIRRTQSNSAKDWASLSGNNLIADITTDNVVCEAGGDVNSIEAGKVEDVTLDANKWYLAYTDGGASTVSTRTYAGSTWAKVDVTAEGNQNYSTQLIGHYNAKEGYVYKVSFDAWAEGGLVGKTATVDSKEWTNWNTYGVTAFMLEAAPTTYSFLIDQQATYDNCRIEVNLGKIGTGTAYVGNMKVEVVDPETLGEDPVRPSKPLATGEYLYNGTFDQGVNKIGYWDATEGTNFNVPSFTTTDLTGNDIGVVDVAAGLANGTDPVTMYYEHRAEVSGASGVAPTIYQSGFALEAKEYTATFELYSEEATSVTAALYSVKEDGTLGNMLIKSKDVLTSSVPGIQKFAWSFEPLRALKNAAFVLEFAEGSTVYVDNVSMMLKEKANTNDTEPMGNGMNSYIEINYVLNGNNAVNSDANPFYYKKGEGTIQLADPTREGYEFAGWSLKEEVQYAEDYVTEVSTNVDSITLYAHWGNKITDSNKVSVTGVSVNETASVEVNKTTTLTTTVSPEGATNKDVTWESEDDTIATVDENGVVTGVKAGTVTITVTTADGGHTDTCEVTVTPAPIRVTDVSLETPASLQIGDTLQLMPVIEPANATNKDVTWKSSNPSIVTVDDNGLITAVGIVGDTKSAIVTVTTVDGNHTADCIVTVSEKKDAAKPQIVTVTKDVTLTEGDAMAALEVAAITGDDGTLSYQWYQNTEDSNEGGTEITGATSASYTPDALEVGTYYYYCVVTNTNTEVNGEQKATAISDVVTYVVEEKIIEIVDAETPSITQQPNDATNYVAGVDPIAAALKVTANVTDGGSLTYQWYKNTSKSTTGATAIAGATKDTYTPNISLAGTTYYYCVVTNTNENANGKQTATATSQIATITAKGVDVSAPAIIGQPSSASYVYGQAATALSMQVVQPTDGTLSYQWYVSTSNAYRGTAIANATQATYKPSTTAAGTLYYYCVVKNTNAKLTGIKTKSVNTAIVSVAVAKAAGTINVPAEVNKQFKKTSFNLNAKGYGTLTYTSSTPKVATVDATGKVTIKNTGKTTITIVAAGDANHTATSTKVVVNVQPKKVTGFKVKSTATGKVTVSWKKNTKATGYEIQYSTSSKFKNAKTVTITKNKTKKQSKTISKLKAGKKYYVRIRAYKNKKKAQRVYSKWTGKKKVTIKK